MPYPMRDTPVEDRREACRNVEISETQTDLGE